MGRRATAGLPGTGLSVTHQLAHCYSAHSATGMLVFVLLLLALIGWLFS